MRRRRFLGVFGAGLLGGALPRWVTAHTGRAPARLGRRSFGGDVFVERWSWAMGQTVHLQLFAASEAAGYEVAQAALTELRRVEHALSRFDEASDLSELNRAAGKGPRDIGVDLAVVLEAAERFRSLTHGAFDPAVEPLMRAWGFHASRRLPPTGAELAEARREVRAARVDVRGRRAMLGTASTQLDLGGIGVGYGLDRMAGLLRGAGILRAFLDVSGDCLAIGTPPGQAGWRVGIADPARPDRVIAETSLRDAALATSANTVSVIRWGRAVRGHVMDPATGYPADALIQATVLARTGVEADALSTAALVRPASYSGVVRAWTVKPVRST